MVPSATAPVHSDRGPFAKLKTVTILDVQGIFGLHFGSAAGGTTVARWVVHGSIPIDSTLVNFGAEFALAATDPNGGSGWPLPRIRQPRSS